MVLAVPFAAAVEGDGGCDRFLHHRRTSPRFANTLLSFDCLRFAFVCDSTTYRWDSPCRLYSIYFESITSDTFTFLLDAVAIYLNQSPAWMDFGEAGDSTYIGRVSWSDASNTYENRHVWWYRAKPKPNGEKKVRKIA